MYDKGEKLNMITTNIITQGICKRIQTNPTRNISACLTLQRTKTFPQIPKFFRTSFCLHKRNVNFTTQTTGNVSVGIETYSNAA
jgi:hypothetical protein